MLKVEAFLPSKLYMACISRMPFACVDLILRYRGTKEFLLLKRKDEPAKGYFWFPGGRLFKGERIMDAAIRKAREEIGVAIFSPRIVGVYETLFPTARPGVCGGTHTVNVVVHGYISRTEKIRFDTHHTMAKWFRRLPRDWDGYLTRALLDAGVLEAQSQQRDRKASRRAHL